ncbi:MAG: HIT family protein [Chloroflexia bacterium]
MEECYSCLSISGERRISPGPTIYAGEHWLVEHAYPVGMRGWLVIVLRRHAEAVHELSGEEFSELAGLVEKSAKALREHQGCEKEYVACFSEAEHFHHVHFHVIAKSAGLPPELAGPGIFRLLKVSEQEAVAPTEIRELCEQLQEYFT